MLDVNLLEQKEEYNGKLNLLKQIKITIESLMFDNGRFSSSRSSMHLSQGILTKFSRHILAVLEDGLLVEECGAASSSSFSSLPFILSPAAAGDVSLYYETKQSEKFKSLWNFVTYIFNDPDPSQITDEKEKISKKEFKQVSDKLKNESDGNNSVPINGAAFNLALEWINESLRMSNLVAQLDFVLSEPVVLRRFYSQASFVLDKSFVDDLLTYLIAYEKRDFKILTRIKRNFFVQMENGSLDEMKKKSHSKSINASPKGVAGESRASTNSSEDKNSLLERAVKELNVSKLKHRRMHSFPNIQINLAKKNLAMAASMSERNKDATESDSLALSLSNHSKNNPLQVFFDSQISNSTDSRKFSIPSIELNNEIKSVDDLIMTEAKKESDELPTDIYAQTTVFDLIHSQQINSESSQLEKENSQFIIADIAIAANELIKTQSLNDEDEEVDVSLTRTKSTRIEIKNPRAVLMNPQDSSFNSISPVSNLNDFVSSMEQETFLPSCHASPSKNLLTSSIIETQSLTDIDTNKIKPSLKKSMSSTSMFERGPTMNKKEPEQFLDFDIINKELIKPDEDLRSVSSSSRYRRFSWEEISDADSAERIAARIIQSLIRRKTKPKIPNLRELEIFIQSLEQLEYMQMFSELRSSVSTKKGSKLVEVGGKAMLGLGMMKAVAVAAATATAQAQLIQTPMNTEQQEKTKTLIRQISMNVAENKAQISNEFRKSISVNKVQDFINDSVKSSNSSLISSYKSMNARIIGDENWAPVRDQLILNLAPKPKRGEQMELQNFRCADCGILVKRDKIKTFNYCEYFGKYFCRCCHVNSQSYIPARIVYQSDYRVTYEVCKKAKNFLEKIYHEPVITLESLNPSLFESASSIFYKVKHLRLKLTNCRSYVNTCRFAAELRRNLYEQFNDFIVDDQDIYSIETLFKLKNSSYSEHLKAVVAEIIEHIKSCELCSQLGYICGLCGLNDLIYPFELEKVVKCPNCLACYHKKCFKGPEQCPRCKRKRNRIQSNN